MEKTNYTMRSTSSRPEQYQESATTSNKIAAAEKAAVKCLAQQPAAKPQQSNGPQK